MECDPTLSEDVAQLARPWLRERLLQLVMAVPPSWKVTFPAGVPAPGLLAVTVAVKVTDCPNTDGSTEERAAVVVPHFAVCVSWEVSLPLTVARPPYDAPWVEERTGLGPSLKVTVPVGVPAPLVFAFTVAVKVTGCPDTDGLIEETTPVVVPGSVVVVVGTAVVVVVVVVVLVVEDVVAGVVVVVVVVVVVGGAVVVVVVVAVVVAGLVVVVVVLASVAARLR